MIEFEKPRALSWEYIQVEESIHDQKTTKFESLMKEFKIKQHKGDKGLKQLWEIPGFI